MSIKASSWSLPCRCSDTIARGSPGTVPATHLGHDLKYPQSALIFVGVQQVVDSQIVRIILWVVTMTTLWVVHRWYMTLRALSYVALIV